MMMMMMNGSKGMIGECMGKEEGWVTGKVGKWMMRPKEG